ncbi:MAG: CoB--CoM heterodisulfide reductase subunit B [Candidatus Lokiarchaeota archaeon]|jgi:heterodisulfide reductase subunit B
MGDKLNYSLFLGCVIPNRYPFIESATRKVAEKLGIEFEDMKGASCCPAPGVFRGFDIDTWLTLGARNINIAEENNQDIVTMCNGCYGSLLDVNHQLMDNEEKLSLVNDRLSKIGREFKGSSRVKHIVEVLYKDIGIQKLTQKLKYGRKPKLNLKVAVHYGCHLIKPGDIRPWESEVEDPRFLDELVEITGCKSVDYKDKLMCCGAAGAVRSAFKKISLDFTREKLENMVKSGAEAIVTACPFCHLQFDLGQVEINKMFKDRIEKPFNIPVIYITQLIGLALGMTPEEVGLVKADIAGVPPFISIEPFLNRISEKIEG